MSRCIDIELKRKRAGEKVEHFRSIDDAGLEELRQQALRWSIDNAESLKGAEPEMPAGFENRLGDNYRLLLAIADLAGGEWPERARQAAQKISGTADTTSAGTRLLAAIRAAFDQTVGGDISSAELMGKLTAEPDSEWAEWRSGKPITQAQLARLLRPFGVAPCPVRIRDQQIRGYRRQQFVESLERYSSGAKVAFESVTSVTTSHGCRTSRVFSRCHKPAFVTVAKMRETAAAVGFVTPVTL